MELKAATYKERVTMTGISSVEAEPEPITLTNEELMKLVKERMG